MAVILLGEFICMALQFRYDIDQSFITLSLFRSDFGSDTMSQRSGSGGETETAISEDELIRSSTVDTALKMKMYFA